VPKFRRAAPFNSEVISAPLLHFKPIFDPPLKKVVRGAAVPGGGALVRLDHSLARFGDIRRRTSKLSEIGPNFACFWPSKFFWSAPLKILERHYKIRPSTDHRGKFQSGRPTHLGDFMLGKKLEIWGKAQRESARRPKSDWGKLEGGG